MVIAEAERDCRFYTAALDAAEDLSSIPVPPSDVLFVPANGKEGMARLAQALRAVAVPVIASPDLDILDDSAVIARLVIALGHDWADLQSDYDVATQPFRRPRDQARIRDVRNIVIDVLDKAMADNPDAPYGAEVRDKVRAALRSTDSPWHAIKQYGEAAFTGEARQASDRLLAQLERRGLVAVRVGELERFAPSLGVAKGKAWLPAALEADAHKEREAQAHISRIMAAAQPR